MRKTVFAALLFALTLSLTAQAQLSAYATPMFTAFGFSTGSGVDTFSHGSGGIGAGIFYDFPIQSRLTAGIDLRGSGSFGSYGGEAFSTSLRIGFVPHKVRLRPYFQLGGGVVSAPYNYFNTICSFSCATTTSSKRATNGAALLAIGLDIRLTHSFDLRAIEYGAEAGPNGNSTNPASDFGFLSTGIVYHLHPRE